MLKRVMRHILTLIATTLFLSFSAPIAAQTPPAPEPYRNVDEFGVDVSTGTFNFEIDEGHIGPDEGGLRLVRFWGQSGWRDNWASELRRFSQGGMQYATITFGGVSERFTLQGSAWVADKRNGATLTSPSAGTWTYRASDGTQITYDSARNFVDPSFTSQIVGATCGASNNATDCAVPTRIVRPNSNVYTLTWRTAQQCQWDIQAPYPEDPSQVQCTVTYRLSDVRSNFGYAMKVKYVSDQDATGSPGQEVPPPTGWWQRQSYRFIDTSQAYCDPEALNCDGSPGNWPTVTYTYPSAAVMQIQNSVAGTWQVSFTNGRVSGVRRPGATADTTTVNYGSDGRVSSVTRDGVNRTYAWSTTGANGQLVATDGTGSVIVVSNPNVGQPGSQTNALGQTVTTIFDANGRHTRVTQPEGNYANFNYDDRGNITEARVVAKAGSGLADSVTTANFDAVCANFLTCNLPNYVIDPLGNRTDYTYSSVHGGVTRVQLPAPSSGGVRPEVNYAYSQYYAQVRDASNALVNAATPLWKVTQISNCSVAATCAGTSNETRVTISYGTPNVLPTSMTTAAGDGSVSSTVTYAYDARDNLISVDGPQAGTADTTTFIIDANDRRRGVVGPDPDGAGARLRVAERYTFDTASRVTKVERGTVTVATAAGLDAMTVLQSVEVVFDTNGNRLRQIASASGTVVSLVQYSYDSFNRLQCETARMNPATWSALPTSACAPATTGSFGADRIVRYNYDALDRVSLVETAVGTTEASREVATTYTANGRVATVTDGENNRTSYVYDGHDRMQQTRYPVTAVGGLASNASDYEQYSYDANGQVLQRRLRDGQTVGFTYDNLGRLTARNLPGAEPDAAYVYDLLGRLTSAAQDGRTVTPAYNALGQLMSVTGPHGTLSYQYDAGGRRTRITHPDGFFVVSDYDVGGNVTAIRENGATTGVGVLASYGFDALGRRTTTTFGNGTVRTATFDNADRLTALANDVAGTTQDQSVSYTYNPVGQINTQTRSNDAYAWTQHYNVDRLYSVNGLNQILTAGQIGLAYDARGNLTTSGTSTYSYNADNRMVTAPGGATLAYDPLGRLAQTSAGSVVTRFAYDGADMVAEYNASNTMLRRYVHGPGSDEPIVWYEGSGTTDRRFLMADERGSVVSVSNASGTVLAINRYDEYGIPASANLGRFQYTGQTWVPEIGMYYYKARMYSPTLGRFMQTDPIGYADGMNWYAYVGGDPVNLVDPLGTAGTIVVIGRRTRATAAAPLFHSSGGSAVMAGEGGGGGGSAAAEIPDACLSTNDGPVRLTGGQFSLVAVAGAGVAFYHFQVLSPGGAHGWIHTGSGLGGVQGFLGAQGAIYLHMGDILGRGSTINVQLPEGLGMDINFNSDGNFSGLGFSWGFGAGLSGGQTRTRILTSSQPMCEG